MALEVETINFTSPASPGNQTISLVDTGLTGKAAIAFSCRDTGTSSAGNSKQMLGITDGTTDRVIGLNAQHSQSTSNTQKRQAAALITTLFDAGSLIEQATHVSFAAGSVTIKWSNVHAGAFNYGLIVLGGDDLTDVDCREHSFPGSTGVPATFATGFDCTDDDVAVILIATLDSTALDNTADDAVFSVGMFTGSSGAVGNEMTATTDDQDAVGTTNSAKYQRSNVVFAVLDGSGAIAQECTVDSLQTDGFDLNFSTSGTTEKFFALTLKGPQSAVINDTCPGTSTPGTKANTDPGFTPKQGLFFSVSETANASVDTGMNMCVGGDDDTINLCSWCGSLDAQSVSDTRRHYATTKSIRMKSDVSALQAEGSVDSWDANGLTIDWTADHSTALEWIGLVMGDAAAGAAANPKGVFGHPFHGPFGGPLNA